MLEIFRNGVGIKTKGALRHIAFATDDVDEVVRKVKEANMEFIRSDSIVELSNPGVTSRQLLNPDNSSSTRVTITEVHLEIGACQPRHIHKASEQIWYATKGSGKLLLADDAEKVFKAGDVVRFADKDVHGLLNDGDEEFVYVSVTAPPINFGYAYHGKK